ncbi:MAG: hypothetical protein R8L07_15730 [Alphaproteobacteria bacterium]|nr:hypothetical protein [Alphaproteobacteria bacterium]
MTDLSFAPQRNRRVYQPRRPVMRFAFSIAFCFVLIGTVAVATVI